MVSVVASQQVQVLAGSGLSVLSLHVLPVHGWGLTRYSGFLPQCKYIRVRLIGESRRISIDIASSLFSKADMNA